MIVLLVVKNALVRGTHDPQDVNHAILFSIDDNVR